MFQSPLFVDFLKLSESMTLIALFLLIGSFTIIKIIEKKKLDFSIRMGVALILGIGLGILIQAIAGFPDPEVLKTKIWIQETIIWYDLFGQSFIGFILMLVIPIIMISMIRVILNLSSNLNIKSLVQRTLFWLLFTTGIAATVGIILSIIVNLGHNMMITESVQTLQGGVAESITEHTVGFSAAKPRMFAREVSSIVDVLLGLVPSNPIKAMVENNVIAVVIFASLIGSSARIMRSKDKYKPVMDNFASIIEASYRIIMSMAMTVIKFMPYAVIALMSRTLISYGFSAIQEALVFIILIYIASAIMIIIYMILIGIHGLNPFVFLKKSVSAWLMAFSSRSSVGSLPMTISTLENRLGVNNGTANFVASLGSTSGMNGCAGYFPAMVAVMVAVMTGTTIDISFIIMVIVVAILGSLGIAGIPGSATMAASIMLSGIGLNQHFHLIAIVLAIDPIIDMARTMINVAGSMTCAICVDKELGTLNIEEYNDMNLLKNEV